MADRNTAFVDWQWDYWTAPGFTDEEHLAKVKRTLAAPGAQEATLGYYRAMFDPARANPGLAEVRQAAGRPGHPVAVIGQNRLGVRQQRRTVAPGHWLTWVSGDRALDQGSGGLLPLPSELGWHLICGDGLEQERRA